MTAGDASLGDGGLHGTDSRGEDVRLLEDLRQNRAVQGAEGCGVVLLRPLVQLQHGELVPTRLGVPVLILEGEKVFRKTGQAESVIQQSRKSPRMVRKSPLYRCSKRTRQEQLLTTTQFSE